MIINRFLHSIIDIPEDDLKWNFESLPTELFDNPTQRNFLQVYI